ncbi:unnamed protein product [Cunninghamella blakesleeana]
MALKLELEQWQSACNAFDIKDYDSALKAFVNMADNAKMHFNIGLIFAAVDDHERALAAYSRSILMDPYFAVAYFQKGVSHFCLGNMQEAMQEFENAHTKLRGNQIINYQQLGLAFRLYACEVLFNRGICRLYLGKMDAGLTDLYHAQKSKMTEEHEVIDQAVRDRGKGYSVFSIPVGVLYRPPESRLRQLHGNIDMFAAVDKLGLSKQQKPIMAATSTITRNNSVLLTSTKFQRKQSLGFPTSSSLSKSISSSDISSSSPPPASVPMRYTTSQQNPSISHSPPMPEPFPVSSVSSHYPRQQNSNLNNNIPSLSSSPQQRQPLQSSTSLPYLQHYNNNNNNNINNNTNNNHNHNHTEDWNDNSSSTSSFASSLRYRSDGRRVDSGFESSHEDRYSTSSRNSTKSHKTSRYSPPPVPPIPKNSSTTPNTNSSSAYDDIFDPMSYSQFNNHPQQQQYDPSSMNHLTNNMQQLSFVEEERDKIRGRLSSNNMADDELNGPRRGSEQSGKSTRSSTSVNQRIQPQQSTSTSTVGSRDMLQQSNKIKIKVHHVDTRVILVPNNITFEELITRVREKLNAPSNTRLQYKDEDNEMVLMIDDDDLQMARQIHRIRNNQDLGVEKMEIWCIT